MGGTRKADDAQPSCGLFILALAIIPLTHMLFLWFGHAAVLDGFLPGQDSYMRLVRVEHLYATGDWFDITLPRSNWPYGEVQNWTRPVDVLMLSGAVLLEPFLGFRQALYWWGSATAPLLHIATALALAWMVAPRLDRSRQLLVVLLFLVQIPVWRHGVLGRTDHHMLIMLTFALALGGALRVLVGPARPRRDLMAGVLAGFGLWLTVEFLVVLAIIFAAFTIRWLAVGEGLARRFLWHGLGLAALVAVALVTERPPGAWLSEV
jgi:asparagine N-glycosylation enzyme membrane subunit Stt3